MISYTFSYFLKDQLILRYSEKLLYLDLKVIPMFEPSVVLDVNSMPTRYMKQYGNYYIHDNTNQKNDHKSRDMFIVRLNKKMYITYSSCFNEFVKYSSPRLFRL